MTRKQLTITITTEGRDQGKTFFITEMSAAAAEDWAFRTFLALAKSGVEIPDDVAQAGLAGLASLSLKALAGVKHEDAKPLLDEMLACVKILPDPAHPNVMRALIGDDVEEVRTRLELRDAVMKLHTGFSLTAAASPSTAATVQKSPLSNIKTSRAR